MSKYAKAIAAIVGAGITCALGIIPPDSQLWQILTVVSAMLTAVGVYLIPNAPSDQGKHARPDDEPIPGTTRTAFSGGGPE